MEIPAGWENCNKKNLGKWIKALRNPRLKQAEGCLERYTEDGKLEGNCCLGVVSRISRMGKFSNDVGYGAGVFTDNKPVEGSDIPDRERSYLSRRVQKWLGVRTIDPKIELPEEYRYSALEKKFGHGSPEADKALPWDISCTKMNDGEAYKLTFLQIADMLEYFVYNNLPDDTVKA